MIRHLRRNTLRPSARRGTAAVEFAVILPVVVLLLLGAIEVSRGIMVQHALQEAAQAGARLYGVGDTSQQDVEDLVAEAMSRAGISKYEIDFTPNSKSQITEHLQPVTVSVGAKYSDVAWLAPNFLAGSTIQGSATMPADLNNE